MAVRQRQCAFLGKFAIFRQAVDLGRSLTLVLLAGRTRPRPAARHLLLAIGKRTAIIVFCLSGSFIPRLLRYPS
jgi:hypothetical protein